MDLIKGSINRPVGISVCVILVVMFGLIGLRAIPIQLTPTVDYPIITVSTSWPGRSPEEVVDEITREQEKRLKNVTNLKSMRSSTTEGRSEITLEFVLGSSIDRALQEVSDSLRQVPAYPDEVDEPTIKAAEGASENAIAWIIIDLDDAGTERLKGYDITTLFDAMDKEVKPFLERIDGVAEVNIYGGRPREVRVLVDPMALAQRSLTHLDVIGALRAENRNVSAGTIAEGKRDYRVRVVGQFVDEQDVLNTVVAYRGGKPVYVRDVGDVEFSHQKQRGFVRALGKPCLAMNVIRQSNANVVRVMEQLRDRLDTVRKDILPRLGPVGPDGAPLVGPSLRMRQVYDETTYIDAAISLVLDNLWVGGVLTALSLILFLRSFVATGVIVLAIPICVIGTFLVMLAFGRTLNVISLAGLAFATGVVVDNANVVLENIIRRRHLGDDPMEATYRGTKEVWTAILAGTLTTVAVFVPILTVQEEAGQLFRDISLAIAAAVLLSLLVAVTVVPAACAKVMSVIDDTRPHGRVWSAFHGVFGLAALCARFADGLGGFVHWLGSGWRAWTVRPTMIVAMTVASIVGSLWLMPPFDYLPTGNRNLVFGGLAIPPGYSLDQMTSIAERLEAPLEPYVRARLDDPASMAGLAPIPRFGFPPPPPFEPVPIENCFIGSFGGTVFVGATSQDENRVLPVGTLLTNVMNTIPAAFGGAQQTSIFGRGIQGANTVNVEVSGPDLGRVSAAARRMFDLASGMYGMRNLATTPGNYNLAQPEVRARLNDLGRELGLTTRDVGTAVRGLFDGAFVDDFRLANDTVDMVVMPSGGRLDYKEMLPEIPVVTPSGRTVPLSSVVDITETTASQEIYRVEELPCVSVRITPPTGMTVEQLMTEIRQKLVGPTEEAGLIDSSMRVRLEGTAAKLDEVHGSLFGRSTGTGTWARLSTTATLVVFGLGAAAIAVFVARAVGRRKVTAAGIGAMGLLLFTVLVGALVFEFGHHPEWVGARFVWAIVVTYLLMCALFESFLYPLVIMFSVPLAMVGGFAGLALVHWLSLQDPTKAPQQLDVVTMLGFVILLGTVVNNAILLVEQALNFMDPSRFGGRERPLPAHEAIRQSVSTRLRPIMMTTLTTLVATIPLVVAPGAGSEMYRGLGAVVLGGLSVSTVFTLVLVPIVFGAVIDMQGALKHGFGRIAIGAAGTRHRGSEVLNGDGALHKAHGSMVDGARSANGDGA